MTTNDEIKQREQEALQLLIEGYSPASIARKLASDHGVVLRTARRYVAAAKDDYFDAPMTRNELEFGLQLQIERLELIADAAKEAGEAKQEIAAIKACASLREARLKALQRESEFSEKTGSASRPF